MKVNLPRNRRAEERQKDWEKYQKWMKETQKQKKDPFEARKKKHDEYGF